MVLPLIAVTVSFISFIYILLIKPSRVHEQVKITRRQLLQPGSVVTSYTGETGVVCNVGEYCIIITCSDGRKIVLQLENIALINHAPSLPQHNS